MSIFKPCAELHCGEPVDITKLSQEQNPKEPLCPKHVYLIGLERLIRILDQTIQYAPECESLVEGKLDHLRFTWLGQRYRLVLYREDK